MMNAVIRSTWARLNSSPSPPQSPTYTGDDEDAASLYNTMTFTPSAVIENLFGRGEEVGEACLSPYFKRHGRDTYANTMFVEVSRMC